MCQLNKRDHFIKEKELAQSKYNELRNSYNDLCEKYGEDDYVGENFYAQQ